MTTPTRRRPGIPADYGIATDDAGMLQWESVAAALASAPIFWVSTVRANGGPHLIPIWGAFAGDVAYFEGGDSTQWARNLNGGDGSCHIGVDHAEMQVMIRGTADQVIVDDATQAAIASGYAAKYPYRPQGSEFWRVTPTSVLAWSTKDLASFADTPTQFEFGDSP